MAYEIPGFSWTLIAAEDFSVLSQFRACDVNGSGAAITPSADGGRAVGVVQNKPAIGQSATVVSSGITKGRIGAGGVTAGQNVQVLSDGTFATAAAADHVVGVALKTNAAGTVGTILLLNAGGGGILA